MTEPLWKAVIGGPLSGSQWLMVPLYYPYKLDRLVRSNYCAFQMPTLIVVSFQKWWLLGYDGHQGRDGRGAWGLWGGGASYWASYCKYCWQNARKVTPSQLAYLCQLQYIFYLYPPIHKHISKSVSHPTLIHLIQFCMTLWSENTNFIY